MGKTKQMQVVSVDASRIGDLTDQDFQGEDGWFMVKKQRVTILIPSLSDAEKSTMPESGPPALEIMPIEAVNTKFSVADETAAGEPVTGHVGKISLLIANKGVEVASEIPECHLSPSKANLATRPAIIPHRRNILVSQNLFGASAVIKTVKQPRLPHRSINIVDGRVLLNQRLRALLLDRKIQNAGGLSKLLVSLGLGQFMKIFRGKSFTKFQMANLTMKKLKDMGANAVGPRRKLMHAIDCICQP